MGQQCFLRISGTGMARTLKKDEKTFVMMSNLTSSCNSSWLTLFHIGINHFSDWVNIITIAGNLDQFFFNINEGNDKYHDKKQRSSPYFILLNCPPSRTLIPLLLF